MNRTRDAQREGRGRVVPPERASTGITPVQAMFLFDTEPARDRGWRQVVERATEVGATDLLAANVRRVRDLEQVRAPLGLYLAIGRMDPALAGYELEHEALRHITRHVVRTGDGDVGPGVLRQLDEDPAWTIESYRTAGVFGRRDLNGDDHGSGQVRYTGSARTTDRTRWPAFLTEHRQSLHHNADWSALLRRWLGDVGAAPAESEVLLHVHNPCDLIATLVHGWPDDLDRCTPMLFGIARTAAGPHRIIRGTLYWNGTPVPDLADRVRAVYRDPMAWKTANTRSRDALLIESLELRYVFFEHVSDSVTPSTSDEEATIWAVMDESPARFTAPFTELRDDGWHGMYALPTFLDEHRGQIDALVSTYRDTLSLSPHQS
jgi:hypothetical protein